MAWITLKQAAQWCGGYVEPQYEDVAFFGANNDTRTLKPQQLFIVLQGARDGHDFIPAAMQKGAAAVLCSRKVGDYPAIYVEDPRIALGKIASQELRRIGCKVVGITGSVGKSTTKEMIAAVLSAAYRISKTPANHNNDIGMPMAVLSMEADTQVAVLEMGMNHFGEIAYLSRIAKPDVAVIINIGTMHIEYLGSREGIRQAKLEILQGMALEGKLLLNGGDDMLLPLPMQISQSLTYFGVGRGCHLRAEDICQSLESLRFRAVGEGLDFPVEMALVGEHFVPDAMAAVAVGHALGVPAEDIRLSLAAFRNMAGRQEIYRKNGFTIIQDCYNAGPESMAAALKVLALRPGRKLAVLADMLELGDKAPAEHELLGRRAAQVADVIFALGPNSVHVARGAAENGGRVLTFQSREEMVRALAREAREGDVLLFKGSHGMHLELVIEDFLK